MYILREYPQQTLEVLDLCLEREPGPMVDANEDKLFFVDGVLDLAKDELTPKSPVTFTAQGGHDSGASALISKGRIFQIEYENLDRAGRCVREAAWVGEPGAQRVKVTCPQTPDISVKFLTKCRPEQDEVLLGTVRYGPGMENSGLRLSVWNALLGKESRLLAEGLECPGSGCQWLNSQHEIYVHLKPCPGSAASSSLCVTRIGAERSTVDIIFGDIEFVSGVDVGKDFLAIWSDKTSNMVVLDLRAWPVKVFARLALDALKEQESVALFAGADLGAGVMAFLDNRQRLLLVRRKNQNLDVCRLLLTHQQGAGMKREAVASGLPHPVEGKFPMSYKCSYPNDAGLFHDEKRRTLLIMSNSSQLFKVPLERLLSCFDQMHR